MSKLSNLPPGVTDRMIEEQAGADTSTPPAAQALADDLQSAYDLTAEFPERRGMEGVMDLLALRNKIPATIAFLRTLPAPIASGVAERAKALLAWNLSIADALASIGDELEAAGIVSNHLEVLRALCARQDASLTTSLPRRSEAGELRTLAEGPSDIFPGNAAWRKDVCTALSQAASTIDAQAAAFLSASASLANWIKRAERAEAALERLVKRTPFIPTEAGIRIELSLEHVKELQAVIAASSRHSEATAEGGREDE